METKKIDLGDSVVCDVCNADFTGSPAEGGMLFGSYGVCSDCTFRMMPDIIKYGEGNQIKARALDGETFQAFCLRMRAGNNTLTITSWSPGEQGAYPWGEEEDE